MRINNGFAKHKINYGWLVETTKSTIAATFNMEDITERMEPGASNHWTPATHNQLITLVTKT
jgi:hypothetical protein